MKRIGLVLIVLVLGFVSKSNSQVIMPTEEKPVISPTEVETIMKDRFCLFGGQICQKTKIKGTIN
jgi:hypothetical protein